MKRFIGKVCAYLIVLGVITGAVNWLYQYKRNAREEEGTFVNVPYGIQVCDFGSSHAQGGYDYSDISDRVCFNFGLGSQSLSYDYRILQYYKDHIQPGAAVFLTVSFQSLFGQEEVERPDFQEKNRRYYTFLPDELIKQYDAKTDLYVNYLPALVASDPISMIKTLFSPARRDVVTTTASPDAARSQAQVRYINHVGPSLANGERVYCQGEIDALYDLIDLCREIGAEPVLITTPFLHEYTDEIMERDPAFLGDFHALMDEICQSADIEYYDYSMDERFVNDYSLFRNIDHLNAEGAKRFTAVLFEEVLGED